MVNRKDWQEFRDVGLLWWINMILHTFGWAIVYELGNDQEITNVYPDRVKFRGFSEGLNTKGYTRLSKYMNENASELLRECEE